MAGLAVSVASIVSVTILICPVFVVLLVLLIVQQAMLAVFV